MSGDFGDLVQRLLARGERVVIVGAGEPMVLLPLGEYEALAPSGVKPGTGTPPARRAAPKAAEPPPVPRAGAAPAPRASLEAVDPQQGSLDGDDQYYPEPLE